MYNNIGGKLRTLAKIIGCAGVAIAVVSLIVILIGLSDSTETLVAGLIGLPVALIMYISSWPLYAFGQLVDDVHNMAPDDAPEKLPEL